MKAPKYVQMQSAGGICWILNYDLKCENATEGESKLRLCQGTK